MSITLTITFNIMLPNPVIMRIRSPPTPSTMDIKCIKKEMKKNNRCIQYKQIGRTVNSQL